MVPPRASFERSCPGLCHVAALLTSHPSFISLHPHLFTGSTLTKVHDYILINPTDTLPSSYLTPEQHLIWLNAPFFLKHFSSPNIMFPWFLPPLGVLIQFPLPALPPLPGHGMWKFCRVLSWPSSLVTLIHLAGDLFLLFSLSFYSNSS